MKVRYIRYKSIVFSPEILQQENEDERPQQLSWQQITSEKTGKNMYRISQKKR